MRTIVLCGSMRFLQKFYVWKSKLSEEGFTVLTPTLKDFRSVHNRQEFLRVKRRENIRHFQRIKRGDAVLVLNYDLGRTKGYIGGSTLAEIGLAFYWKKPIYLVNPIPKTTAFREELEAWRVMQWQTFKARKKHMTK